MAVVGGWWEAVLCGVELVGALIERWAQLSDGWADAGRVPERYSDGPRPSWPAHWPTAARELADLLLAALWRLRACAEDADPAVVLADPAAAAALADAITELAKRGDAALALQASMVRDLLERAYPDGVTGQRVREVLLRCIGAAPPLLDDEGLTDDLALVLGGALGISDGLGESAGHRAHTRTLRAGLLVLDDLLSRTGLEAASVLETSVGEIVRSETMEMP